mgnify:CR=1 FL=1
MQMKYFLPLMKNVLPYTVIKIVTSQVAHERAKIQCRMSREGFKNYVGLRNGAETVPSNICKDYHLEKIPRGKQRGMFFRL